jgi:hypothetical protein
MGDVGDIGDCSVPKYEALFVFAERGELGTSDLGGARGASDVGLKAKFWARTDKSSSDSYPAFGDIGWEGGTSGRAGYL